MNRLLGDFSFSVKIFLFNSKTILIVVTMYLYKLVKLILAVKCMSQDAIQNRLGRNEIMEVC